MRWPLFHGVSCACSEDLENIHGEQIFVLISWIPGNKRGRKGCVNSADKLDAEFLSQIKAFLTFFPPLEDV